MRLRYITAIAITAMALNACDEDTGTIGTSLVGDNDNMQVSTQQFNVLTSSFIPDSIYAASEECYLGRIKDPETGTITQSEFTVQFNMMEQTSMPNESDILSKEGGKVIADSCEIRLYFDMSKTFGDSLTAMKIKVSELDRPIAGGIHYSNFDPKAEGYVRTGGLNKLQVFSRANLTFSDSIRKLSSYYPFLSVRLNQPYTDKDGVTYNNYGSYILQKFYSHPEYFKNSYNFIHHICPGFLFETVDGQGLMAKFEEIDFRVYYKFKEDTTTYVSYLGASSTEEVLQTIRVTNDKAALSQLAKDNSCTYLKSPAGIFTEVTLPVDEIKATHGADSLLSASVTFNRINSQELTSYTLTPPAKIMLIQKDSLYTFFENNRNYDNQYAFYTALSNNAYIFATSSDISNLVVRMYNAKQQGLKTDPDWLAHHPNWNKAVLVPVSDVEVKTTTTSSYYYYTSSSTTTSIVGQVNNLGLTSTRLVRGTSENPIKIKIIYAKFKE